MGVLDYGSICLVDEQKCTLCPGYFGHIELARPVFYIHFKPQVLKTLRCICFRCSKLLIDPEEPVYKKSLLNLKGINRFQKIYSFCSKVKRCGSHNNDGCGAIQPTKYSKDSINNIDAVWKYAVSGLDKKVSKQR